MLKWRSNALDATLALDGVDYRRGVVRRRGVQYPLREQRVAERRHRLPSWG